MSTPERKKELAASHEAIALKLRREAEQKGKKQMPVSPPVEIPTVGPDGKIKKPRWEAHQICGEKITEAEIDALLKQPKDKPKS
jgi:hypothetical protein